MPPSRNAELPSRLTGAKVRGPEPAASNGFQATGNWRTVDLFVPTELAAAEFTAYIHSHIRGIAHEGGEFIDRIAIGPRSAHSLTWWRCSVSYLPGPPGTLWE